MDQLSWLEKNLDNEKKRLFSARKTLKKNPHSYSARVALQSAENRLKELEKRLDTKTDGCVFPDPSPF